MHQKNIVTFLMSKLRVVTARYELGKSETSDIRQALTTDWFHEKFNGKVRKAAFSI